MPHMVWSESSVNNLNHPALSVIFWFCHSEADKGDEDQSPERGPKIGKKKEKNGKAISHNLGKNGYETLDIHTEPSVS